MSVYAESTPISDGDRLVAALETCIRELSRKQEEQGERLYRAVEALKPPAPTADKKTAFWNAYMKLADEHDKEFREKYGTDLDTALIFAGLFSAVSSAFIIQIQPLLVANVPTVIVVVQALQYISLFTALLAALLAVLGKQWIMYYNAAGSRGTIEERGLERQRKLDGLVKWKFEAVLQMFPLLLQLALLLFATSIAVYLFTIHLSIAIIVMVLTVLGLGAYLFLLVSAVIYPDSPFQTPLTPLLVRVVSRAVHWLRWLRYTLRPTLRGLDRWRSAMVELLHTAPPLRLLPRFASKEPSAPTLTDPYSWLEVTPPSPEVRAVLWTFGTSTDPITIGTAAELGLDLQWPAQWEQSFDLATRRLADTFASCFEEPFLSDAVRTGTEQLAFSCGRLFCILHSIADASTYHPPSSIILLLWDTGIRRAVTAQEVELLRNIIARRANLLTGNWRQSPTVRWALHAIPLRLRNHDFEMDLSKPNTIIEEFLSQFPVDYDQQPDLDLPTFTNYLCCICSLLGDVDVQIKMQMDKSGFRDTFMIHFFRLLPPGFHSMPRILRLTAALNKRVVLHASRLMGWRNPVVLTQAMLEFCPRLPREHGWLDLVVSAASLVRMDSRSFAAYHGFASLPVIGPVQLQPLYLAVAHVQRPLHVGDPWDGETTLAIDGLLQALAYNESLPANPPIESLTIILRALSEPTNVALSACLLLSRAKAWFLDPRLQPVMQQRSVMHLIGQTVLKYKGMSGSEWLGTYSSAIKVSYFGLMESLASIPQWQSTLWPELPTWLEVFPIPDYERDPVPNSTSLRLASRVSTTIAWRFRSRRWPMSGRAPTLPQAKSCNSLVRQRIRCSPSPLMSGGYWGLPWLSSTPDSAHLWTRPH
ncbi:hypothetical protein C8R46DRAFT_1076254 [Mycena filopes]|nr:hypothetical protein C8R46DRAFT_1076254 [Mycena filopes]